MSRQQDQTDSLKAIINNELPPLPPASTDPIIKRYADDNISPDARTIIESALNLREASRQLNEKADQLLRQGDEQIELDLVGASLAGRFDYLFHEIMNSEPFDRRLSLNQAYLTLPLAGTSVETVRIFINENFDGANADRLLILTNEMTDDDVEELAQIIFGKARNYAYLFDVSLALSLYVCQEHVPYNTIPGAWETFKELEIPQLGTGKLATVEQLIGYCQLFPTGLEPASFHEPVVSDIPTLIVLGTANTQTAISWGQHAAETPGNSRGVLFPETSHGAIRYSQCARDMGAAFFNNPEGNLNTSCTADLLPQLVLSPE